MPIYVEFTSPISAACEARSVSFGAGRESLAAGGIRRVAQRNDFSFSKDPGNLSGALMNAIATGTIFKAVTVKFFKTDNRKLYMTYWLTNTVVDSYSSNSSFEQIGLVAEKITSKYF